MRETIPSWHCLLFIVASLLAGFILGTLNGCEHMEIEAVDEGHAEYYIDKYNHREWRWLPIEKEDK